MDMPKDFRIRNYVVNDVAPGFAAGDYIVYNMTRDGYKAILVCEYFPRELAERADSGYIKALDGKEEEYKAGLDHFIQIVSQVKALGLPEFVKVEEYFEDYNTCYAALDPVEGIALTEYLNNLGGRLTCKDALELIDPFVLSLIKSAEQGILYKIEVGKMEVSPGGRLRLDTIFRLGYTQVYMVEDLANLFYTLITGQEYIQVLARPAQLVQGIAPALDELLYNTLFTTPRYQTVAEFYAALKNAADNLPAAPYAAPAEETAPPSYPPQGAYPQQPGYPYPQAPPYPQPAKNNTGKIVGGCAIFGCLGVVAIIIMFGILVANIVEESIDRYGSVTYYTEEPAILEPNDDWQDDYNYAIYTVNETYAYTNVENADFALNGTLLEYDGYAYYSKWEYGWQFVRENIATGEQELILEDILPAFMAADNGFIVFSDALNDYYLYYYDIENQTTMHIGDERAAYMVIHNGAIYYSNLDDWCSIYKIDFEGYNSQKLNEDESEYLNIIGNDLYYISTYYDFMPYTLNLDDYVEFNLVNADSDNLVAYNGLLFYVNYDTQHIDVVDTDGNLVNTYNDFIAYYFDIKGDVIYYSDYDGEGIYAYNMATGENMLITDAISNYFKVFDSFILYYSNVDGILYRLDFTTWEAQAEYTDDVDFNFYYNF